MQKKLGPVVTSVSCSVAVLFAISICDIDILLCVNLASYVHESFFFFFATSQEGCSSGKKAPVLLD